MNATLRVGYRTGTTMLRSDPLSRSTVRMAAVWLAAVLQATGCSRSDERTPGRAAARAGVGGSMAFTLSSKAFAANAPIPKKHTCDGADVSPPLTWGGTPAGSKAFALINDDPDAPRPGGWVHWVLYDLPGNWVELPENVAKQETLSTLGGARQGKNDFGKIGFNGSCPPPGKPHHYHFKLYALDAALGLKPGARRSEVERAMEGHVLGIAELVGIYERR